MKTKKTALLLVLIVLILAVAIWGISGHKTSPSEDLGSLSVSDKQDSTDSLQSPINVPDANLANIDKNTSAPWESLDMEGIPELIDTLDEDPKDPLMIVNKLHATSENYKPTNMVRVDPALSTWSDLTLKKDAYEAYLKLHEAANEKGFKLKICSAYRSYATQVTLYNNSMKNRGEKLTNVRSAYPGRSEHHTGYAIDITSKSMGWGLTQDFANYPDGKWIDEHCMEYGFIIRYPEGKTNITGYAYEPWHLRYVGVEAATEITEKGLTLEEYLGR